MILSQHNKQMLLAIMEIEKLLVRNYHLDPESMFDRMSILDIQYLMDGIRKEKEEENRSGGDKLMKSLIAIRDILNYMTLPT